MQLHVMTLAVGHHRNEVPTELEALGDKSTNTLATSLEGALRGALRGVLPTNTRGPEIWLVHFLIGDAIPTNDSAARVLWASVQQRPLGERIRYFLGVIKCMTHQTGLSAKSGLIGPAAATAGCALMCYARGFSHH